MKPTKPHGGRSQRRIFVLGALWASLSGAVLLAPSCYPRNCEGTTLIYGPDAGQGEMLDDETWESSPQEGPWLFFPRQAYYIFDIRALGGRTPEIILPYISVSPTPNTTGSDFTPASGNHAKLFNALPNRVDIKNDTCSDYYLRLVVKVPSQAPEAPHNEDGGADESEDNDAGDAGNPGS
ncbi:MAG TPA: hypothetical protein VM580_22135 [Labilithrix sp.]|nr:hypothetical protein [Labilithrix sp.]